MKFAIVLCLALFVAVNAGSVQDKIHELFDKVDAGIAAAIDKAQEVVDATKDKANELGDNAVKAVEEEVEKINARVTEFFEKFGDKLEEIIGNAEDPNAVECRKLAENFRDTVLDVTTNTSFCLNEKIPTAVGYVEEITETSTEVLAELHETRAEAHVCVENIEGLKNATLATVCLSKAGAKASWISVKKVPKISYSLAKLTAHVSTLPVTLPYCAISTGFNDVIEGAKDVIHQIEKCYEEGSTKEKAY